MKRFRRTIIVLGIVGVLAAFSYARYRATFPYGQSHCCILGLEHSLESYADKHGGRYPTGESSPEASLSLLYRAELVDAYTLRGMTVPERTARAILDHGGLLGPDTCGWHYTDGLTRADDPHIALLYCKEPLGHNGQVTKDGGRQVLFVGAGVDWVSGSKWPAFLEEQKQLLAQRAERAKAARPTAIPMN